MVAGAYDTPMFDGRTTALEKPFELAHLARLLGVEPSYDEAD